MIYFLECVVAVPYNEKTRAKTAAHVMSCSRHTWGQSRYNFEATHKVSCFESTKSWFGKKWLLQPNFGISSFRGGVRFQNDPFWLKLFFVLVYLRVIIECDKYNRNVKLSDIPHQISKRTPSALLKEPVYLKNLDFQQSDIWQLHTPQVSLTYRWILITSVMDCFKPMFSSFRHSVGLGWWCSFPSRNFILIHPSSIINFKFYYGIPIWGNMLFQSWTWVLILSNPDQNLFYPIPNILILSNYP